MEDKVEGGNICREYNYKGTKIEKNQGQEFVSREQLSNVSQKVTYLFCDELDIVSKELRSGVRQATKDVVKSEV